MIKIGAVYGSAFVLSQDRLQQVQEIFRLAFPDLAGYAEKIPSLLKDPVQHGYRSMALVGETEGGRVDGFALLLHFADQDCCFLDFIAVRPGIRGGGIGGALYEAAREYCQRIGAKGLYLEVDPDDPELTPDPKAYQDSRNRMRFYEQHGARVVDNTAYATPVGDPPLTAYLLYDGLGSTEPLSRQTAQAAVHMILTRRFKETASPDYVRMVVDSFQDDPVQFRPLRYIKDERVVAAVESQRLQAAFALITNPKHELHHIRERGYFERPVRLNAITDALAPTALFTIVKPGAHGERPIRAVHDSEFVHYLQTICAKLKDGRPLYPDTFPIRRPDRRPRELPVQAGYYCLDTGTPLYHNAYVAARAAVDTALSAADEILSGRPLAYAACRPPGHHAGKRFFGGFCYFNNAAIAAQYFVPYAKIAILDIDFHHGNGTQDIFYDRDDVLTVSIHGDPDYAYPYFSGYKHETGAGAGSGFNCNFPLSPQTEANKYLRTFERAVELVEQFDPDVLVVGLGFDTMRGDPTGTFSLSPGEFTTMGERLMAVGCPILVVQEGGYSVRNIKRGSVAFFRGCAAEYTRQLGA